MSFGRLSSKPQRLGIGVQSCSHGCMVAKVSADHAASALSAASLHTSATSQLVFSTTSAIMRLLNTKDLRLVEFGDNAPPYAIASHRWTAQEEVLFQTLARHLRYGAVGQSSRGLKKLQGFCRSTKGLDSSLEWIWIDNCCIDKTNPHELNKSINSMFRWYANAVVCIAYLVDVEDAQQLPGSKWFRRGWTLQELLAPGSVIILSKTWQVIGHKCPGSGACPYHNVSGPVLNPQLSAITIIPEDVLRNIQNATRCSLEQKFDWYQDRQTLEPEDRYHSLIGIMDIPMPLQYGVGASNAKSQFLHQVSVAHGQDVKATAEWCTQNWSTSTSLETHDFSIVTNQACRMMQEAYGMMQDQSSADTASNGQSNRQPQTVPYSKQKVVKQALLAVQLMPILNAENNRLSRSRRAADDLFNDNEGVVEDQEGDEAKKIVVRTPK